MGRRAGDRARAGVPHDPPGAAHRARGPRGARACRIAPRASPSRRRSRGAWSSASRSRGGSGRRGPAGAAYQAVGDHWRWFGRVVAERKTREGDPIIGLLERAGAEAEAELRKHPDDRELVALHEWLSTFLVFVRLFDRAVGLVPRLEPRELERGLRLLGEVDDETVLRLVGLLEGLDDKDVLDLVDALSRLSPTTARRATKLMSGVVRTVIR